MNLARMVVKPLLESKLKLKKLYKCEFKAYKKKDLLELSGFGMLPNSIMFGHAQCDPLKVSEESSYEALLIRNIKKNVSNYKQWDVCYLNIDYEQGIIKTEVWYETDAGKKTHLKFENKI